MYHFPCADISHASILEIGCRSGDNLLRQAEVYPQSTCVGVDIDPDRIAVGVAQVEKKRLANIHLYCMGLGDLLSIDVGKFDFIILPSIYSLLDPTSRSALLSWCEGQLSERGVIAVRWNTQPGARANRILQQAIAFHTRYAQTEQAWLTSARAMLSFMDMSDPDGSLKEQVAQTLHLTDAELLAQYLEENNDASLLTEFTANISASQLRMIGEVIPQYEMASHYGSKIESLIQAVSTGKDRTQIQQYLDFAVQRSERFSLLISQRTSQHTNDCPDLNQLASLHWAASYAVTSDENQRITRFSDKVDTSHPDIRRILDWLSAAWPRSLSSEQIIQHTFEPEKPEQHREIILNALQALYLNKPPLLYVSAFPSPYNTDSCDKLKLNCTFSEEEVAGGSYCARTNWWGERLAFKREEFALYQNGLRIDNEQDARIAIELAGKGLLSGSALCWTRFWQGILGQSSNAMLEGCLRSYLLAISPVERGGMLTASEERTITTVKPKETVNVKKARKIEELMLTGYYAQAKEATADLLATHPEDSVFLMLAADVYRNAGDVEGAINLVSQRLSKDGQYLNVLSKLGMMLVKRSEQSPTAKLIFQHLLKMNQANSGLWGCLSAFYHATQNVALEEHCLLTAIEHNQGSSTVLMRLAMLYSHTDRLEEAKALCLRSLALHVDGLDRLQIQGLYLFLLSHDPVLSAEEKFREHVEYGKLASRWAQTLLKGKIKKVRDSGRVKLRLGFVSGDLNSHPVHSFLYPVWQAIDRQRYELYAYGTGKCDAVTDLYRSSAAVYRQVDGLGWHELALQIEQDEIDILIDLSGYTSGHRLPTFALKPAPVQMSWIGFVGTTGLQEMDYYIMGDGLAKPGELDAVYTEKLISLPSAKIFEYSPLAPAVNELPALKNGYLTLGSFNRPQKLTAEILDCWASILMALPQARLLFGFMLDEKMSAHYAREMARRGISDDRLDFRTKQEFIGYQQLHNEVDLLLDAHPYSAGTTAHHALWMGVPLVTAIEGSPVSRTAAVALKMFGLEEFVTSNLKEYAQKVIDLNTRYEHLNSLRLSMRERILRREKSHTHNACYFEKMIDAVWQRHLNGEPPVPLFIEDEYRVERHPAC